MDMPTTLADTVLQHKRLLERKTIKQLLYKLSTTPVPEKKPSDLVANRRPSYLRYIEYI